MSSAACASCANTIDHTPAPLIARTTPTPAKPRKYETVSAIAIDLKSRSRCSSASAMTPGPCSRNVNDETAHHAARSTGWWKKSAMSGAVSVDDDGHAQPGEQRQRERGPDVVVGQVLALHDRGAEAGVGEQLAERDHDQRGRDHAVVGLREVPREDDDDEELADALGAEAEAGPDHPAERVPRGAAGRRAGAARRSSPCRIVGSSGPLTRAPVPAPGCAAARLRRHERDREEDPEMPVVQRLAEDLAEDVGEHDRARRRARRREPQRARTRAAAGRRDR